MPGSILRKRPHDEEASHRPPKRSKAKRQLEYHSSSEDDTEALDFRPVDLANSDDEEIHADQPTTQADNDDEGRGDTSAEEDVDDGPDSENVSDDADLSEASTSTARKKRKRNDPDAFATSISKILGSKLSNAKRADPVLSRSKSAATVTRSQADAKLEERARRKLREEKKQVSEKGRIRDVLGTQGADGQSAEEVQDLERRLRKTAQRGVVKLFNAVRAAQVKGEEAEREARRQGLVGVRKREEKINEMSKKGFLDLIAGGGKKANEVQDKGSPA